MRLPFVAALLTFICTGASAEQIWVTMDQVRPYTIKKPASEIIVGNPGIADVTVRDNQRILLFGKSPGLTNVFIFDEDGGTIDNLTIRVKTPLTQMLTMQRGAARTTYNCTTHCEVALTVGDDQVAFERSVLQAQQKYQQAQQAAN